MDKSKAEKGEEITIHALEQFQKLVLGFMPGGHLVHGFLNYRSGLKQQRILSFAESLKVAFEKELGKDLENYNFENEVFVDVIDSVMSKVQNNKSEFKLERFRDIVVNSVKEENDLAQIYIELTSALSEVQIKLLYMYDSTEDDRKGIIEDINRYNRAHKDSVAREKTLLAMAESGTLSPNVSIKAVKKVAVDNMFNQVKSQKLNTTKNQSIRFELGLDESEFEYYFRDLISKSLLREHDYDVLGDGTSIPYTEVTEFAKGYLAFIKFDEKIV